MAGQARKGVGKAEVGPNIWWNRRGRRSDGTGDNLGVWSRILISARQGPRGVMGWSWVVLTGEAQQNLGMKHWKASSTGISLIMKRLDE